MRESAHSGCIEASGPGVVAQDLALGFGPCRLGAAGVAAMQCYRHQDERNWVAVDRGTRSPRLLLFVEGSPLVAEALTDFLGHLLAREQHY